MFRDLAKIEVGPCKELHSPLKDQVLPDTEQQQQQEDEQQQKELQGQEELQQQEVGQVEKLQEEKQQSDNPGPTVYMITPTYARLTQKSDLTSVCLTIMHVPKLVWIVIEDSDHKTDLVSRLLSRCKAFSVHLNVVTPEYYKHEKWKPRGVLQRNTGLSWIREHHTKRNCSGIVYFGDDDNSYDLRLFEKVRS